MNRPKSESTAPHDGVVNNSLRPDRGLRFAISSGRSLVVIISAMVGGIIGCFIFLWWWQSVAIFPHAPVHVSEALNFAGVMITILAFVSTFYILVVAIDAFKISSDIAENRKFIDDNRVRLEDFENRLRAEEKRLADLQREAGALRNEAQLSADILQELNTAEEDTRKILRRFERTHSALDALCDFAADGNLKSAKKAKAYTEKLGEQLSGLIDDNDHRRARIVLLASMVAGDLPSGVHVRDFHVQAVRAEAAGDGLHAQRAAAVLAKYNTWLTGNDAERT